MFHKVSKVFHKKKSASAQAKTDNRHDSKPYSGALSQTESCKQFERIHGSAEVTCIAAAKSPMCLSGAKNCELALTQSSSAEVIHKWHAHEKEITKVSCGGENLELFASASRDKTVCLWQQNGGTTNAEPLHRYMGHDLMVTGVALSPSGTQMLSGSRDNTLRLWDVAGGECVRITALAQNVVTHVCWGRTPSTSSVAQSSEDKTVRLWDTRCLRVAVTTAPKQNIQTCCDLSGTDDKFCLSSSNGFGGNGCETTLWDMRASGQPVYEFTGHFETVTACCFLPTSSQFLAATCSNDGTVRLWNCQTGSAVATVSIPAFGPLTGISAGAGDCLYVSSYYAGIQVLSLRKISCEAEKVELERTIAF